MSSTLSLKAPSRVIPVKDATWAGHCPWTGSYCLGLDSGQVLICRESSAGIVIDDFGALAEEAINGVAFHGPHMAVSTRSEVSVYEHSEDKLNLELASPGGAHGVLATPSGQFVAPAGTDGLLCLDARAHPDRRVWYDHPRDRLFYWYALAYLGNSSGKDILTCAAQTDGLLTIQFENGQAYNQIVGWSAPNVDFISVCSLNSNDPFAVAALARDGSLSFIRDVLTPNVPIAVRLEDLRGAPYSVLSGQGHIFILTSHEIVVLPGLASAFLSTERIEMPIDYISESVEAVDAFVVKGEKLLILTDDAVVEFNLKTLVEADDGLAMPQARRHFVSRDAGTWTPFSTERDCLVAQL
jgi:hypothetical protein